MSLDQSPFADVPQTQAGWTALSAGQNFTQDDVELNRLWYEHAAAAAAAHGFKGHDSFGFSLTDLDNKSPAQSFSISINVPQKGQRSRLTDRPCRSGTLISPRGPQVTWCCGAGRCACWKVSRSS